MMVCTRKGNHIAAALGGISDSSLHSAHGIVWDAVSIHITRAANTSAKAVFLTVAEVLLNDLAGCPFQHANPATSIVIVWGADQKFTCTVAIQVSYGGNTHAKVRVVPRTFGAP